MKPLPDFAVVDHQNEYRIYELDGGYVIADDAGWYPGVYATPGEAIEALRRGDEHDVQSGG